ncbi:hypothetical protein [Arabiibacter massiliensis]|uniref:hypothetical protein n=1 Tax=Arabiibacter massiliensis TaxID=1870985 RepID=UPI0009B9E1D9|nr:hypothetical protein [Arabiibacter massiliensis]
MRKTLSIVIATACIALAVLCGFRIAQVNAAYPEQHSRAFSIGEEATYAGQDSSGGQVEYGSILVRAEGSSLVDYEGLKALVPDHIDSFIEDGTFRDMRALFVEIEMRNASSEVKKVYVRDFSPQSGAWTNGLYAPLYMTLNDDPSTIIELEPGEKASRTLVYLMYDGQFSGGGWERVSEREFELVLALYPDKYLIELGVPSAGGREGSTV